MGNITMGYRLCALFPPGSVEKEIAQVQEKLFKSWGLVSALALPPLIPLFFLPPDLPIPDRVKLKAAADPAFYCSTQNLVTLEGHLFWEVLSSGRLKALKSSIKQLFPRFNQREAPRLFPEFEGFFLSSPEIEQGFKEVITCIGSLPVIRFPAAALSVLTVDNLCSDRHRRLPGSGWWESIQWEEIIAVPLKKPKLKRADSGRPHLPDF
ncbi:hypothetical protein ES703_89770 [subsurface metagenome]